MSGAATSVSAFDEDLSDADATRALGARLAAAPVAGSVVLLDGPLGAGKTTFVQGFARGLGAAAAASPSFVLAHLYPGGAMPVWHLDLYRLDDPAAIEDLDLEHYLPADGIALVEWASRHPWPWPPDRIEVALRIVGEGRRAAVRGVGRCAAVVRAAAPAGGAASRATLG